MTACDASGACIAPTQFTWADTLPPQTETTGPEDEFGLMFGDGPDAVPIAFTAMERSVMADLDGDGASEMFFTREAIQVNGQQGEGPAFPDDAFWRVWRVGSDGTFIPSPALQSESVKYELFFDGGFGTGYAHPPTQYLDPVAGDIDGDNRDEVIVPVAQCEEDCIDWVQWADYGDDLNFPYHYATSLQVIESNAPGNIVLERSTIDASLPARIYMVPPPADVDGDGHIDFFLCGGENFRDANWHLLRRRVDLGPRSFENFDLGLDCSEFNRYEGPFDIDGDGEAELLVGLNTVDQLEPPGNVNVHQGFYKALGGPNEFTKPTNLPVDFNARYITTMCLEAATYHQVGFTRMTTGHGPSRWADWNGDGLIDVLRFEVYQEGAIGNEEYKALDSECKFLVPPPTGPEKFSARLWINTGSGFVPRPSLESWDDEQAYPGAGTFKTSLAVDLNDDGISDWLTRDYSVGDAWRITTVNGDQTSSTAAAPYQWPWLQHARASAGLSDRRRQNLLVFFPGGVASYPGAWRSYGRAEFVNDVVIAAQDGLGRTDRFTYGSANDPELHHPELVCPSDQQCDLGTQRLLKRIELDSGDTTPLTRSFTYWGGRYARNGQGFLGFSEVVWTEKGAGAVPLRMGRRMFTPLYDATFHEFTNALKISSEISESMVPDATDATGYSRWLRRTGYVHTPVQSFDGLSYFTYQSLVSSDDFVFPGSICASLSEPCRVSEVVAGAQFAPAYRQIYETQTQDSRGNLTLQQSSTGDHHSTRREFSDFWIDDAAWVLGYPREIHDVAVLPDNSSHTRVVRRSYDATTRALTHDTREPTDPAFYLDTGFSLDAFGNIKETTQTNTAGVQRVLKSTWEPTRGIVQQSQANALAHTTSYTYDLGSGAVLTETEPNGTVSEWTYDTFARPATFKRRSSALGPTDGNDTTYSYAWDNTVPRGVYKITQLSQNGEALTRWFDRLNREVRACWPQMKSDVVGPYSEAHGPAICRESMYDIDGNNKQTTTPFLSPAGPAASWFRTFDPLGRVQYSMDADGRTTTLRYTPLGQQITDEKGNSEWVTTNQRGEVVQRTDAIGTTTCFTYWPFGDLHTVKPSCASGAGDGSPPAPVPESSFTYDRYGNLTKASDPDRGTIAYTYSDGYRQLTDTENAKGEHVGQQYDALGRIKTITTAEGPITFTWDVTKLGYLDQKGGLDFIFQQYQYDAFLRVRQITYMVEGAPYTFQYDYTNNRLTKLTYPGNFALSFIYDGDNYLRQVAPFGGGAAYFTADGMSVQGGLDKFTYGNGIKGTRTYDWAQHITSSAAKTAGGTKREDLAYVWGEDGQLERRLDKLNSQAQTFTYDKLRRIRKTETFSAPPAGPETLRQTLNYDYDAMGNLVYKSGVGAYSYDYALQGNRAKKIGGVAQHWDAAGQLESRGAESFSWTSFGQPREVHVAGAGNAKHLYDGEFERVRTYDLGSGTISTFVGGLYQEDRTAALVRKRYSIQFGDTIVAQYRRDETPGGAFLSDAKEYVHGDHIASPHLVTAANGSSLRDVMFDAFGTPTRGTDWTMAPLANGSSVITDFTGHEQRIGSDIVNMRGRHYDSKNGRFISADPIIANQYDMQEYAPYSYVSNNPLRLTDPSGWRSFNSDEGVIATEQRAERDCNHHPDDENFLHRVIKVPTKKGSENRRVVEQDPSFWNQLMRFNERTMFRRQREENADRDPRTWRRIEAEKIRKKMQAAFYVGHHITQFGAGLLPLSTLIDKKGEIDVTSWSYIAGAITQAVILNPGAAATKGPNGTTLVFSNGGRTGTAAQARAAEIQARQNALILRPSRAGYRLHGEVPTRGDLRAKSTEELVELREMTRTSIKTREGEIRALGDKGRHGSRLGEERRLRDTTTEILNERGVD